MIPDGRGGASMKEKKLLNEKEAAFYLGVSVSLLRQLRTRSYPSKADFLPFYKIGRSVRYRLEDLDEWLEKRRVER
jgi:predicted DNA-binding transcriptional regulator AlpA